MGERCGTRFSVFRLNAGDIGHGLVIVDAPVHPFFEFLGRGAYHLLHVERAVSLGQIRAARGLTEQRVDTA